MASFIEEIYYNNMHDLLIPDSSIAHIIDRIEGHEGSKQIIVEENAQLTYLLVCENSTLDLEIVCEGENAQIKVFAIFLGSPDSMSKVKVIGNIRASHCSANLYMLSLLGNKSSIDVDGIVEIGPGLIQASGHLLEENLILGDKVTLKTLPMLDVRSNDVSASHGCKIDKVNADNLFYMTSKGIPDSVAQRLIIEGYVNNVVENFKELGEDNIYNLRDHIVAKVITS